MFYHNALITTPEVKRVHDFDFKYVYDLLISYNACKVLTCTILCGIIIGNRI